jgi:putative flippase GtrA
VTSPKTITEQFVKFGIVGVSNTLISLLIYYIFIFINMKLYLVGSIVGFLVSVLNSYFWNNRYVFKAEKRNHVKALMKTYLSYGLTSLLSIGLLVILVEVLNVSEIMAPIINLAITIPLNFLLNKFWAFKE